MSGWQAYLEGLYPDVLAPADLKQAAAAGLTRLLLSESYAGADLVLCRGGNAVHVDANLLIADIHVDLGQRERRVDIRAVERVGIIYVAGDMLPAVYPLRYGFPSDLPHLNISFKGTPQSLCLFEMDGEEALRLAVPFVLIERIRFWMRETAYGRLHGDDQPLDPVIMSTGQVVVLPLPGEAEEASPVFYGIRASDYPGCPAILLPPAAVSVGMRARRKNGFSAIHVTTEPLSNGRIRNYPRNVAELVDIYSELSVDLVPVLRAAFMAWVSLPDVRDLLQRPCIIVVRTPIRRSDGTVGGASVKAFLTQRKAEELAVSLGALVSAGEFVGRMINVPPPAVIEAELAGYSLIAADVHRPFDRAMAQASSGAPGAAADPVAATLVGAGALGSQLALAAARMGVGRWSIVDPDHLMPHNLARHALTRDYLGWAKAEALAVVIRDLLGPDAAEPFVENAGARSCEKALAGSDLVIDASASVPVARWLGAVSQHPGRTASVFLNPSGSDLVILREGAFREPRLDHVEMSYYWAVANMADLEDHLADGRVGLFPSGGCRRASLRLPQSSVGLLASLTAQRLLRDECPEEATAEIWRTSTTGVAVRTLPTDRYREAEIDGWTLSVSERVIAGLGEARRAASPCETGGIVVGTWDRVRKRAYVAGHYDPPPDSVGTRATFVRGAVGVYRTLESLSLRTAGNLGYVGEWHTHPPGHSSDPSPDDAILLEWIGDVLIYSDVPPLMLIAGEDGVRLVMGMRSRSAVMPYTHVKAAQCADGAKLSCKSQTECPTPPC